MRNFLTLLILIFFCASPSIAQKELDKDRRGFIGPVRTIRVETAFVTNVSGQSVEGPRVLTQLGSFDEKGTATGQTIFNLDGSLKFKYGWATSYDAKGRDTERIFYNAAGVPTSKSVSTYDEKGRRVETTFFNPDGPINHIEDFIYDSSGKMVQQVHRNPDGTIRNTQTYTYDNRARLTAWSLYKPDGTPFQRNVSTYDDKGRETGLTVYLGDGTPTIEESRSYDDRWNVIEVLRYRNGVLIKRETLTYEFDARGNWVKRNIARETVQGNTSRSETEVNYRTITYY